LNLPALCFMAIFSKDILYFLYGEEFAGGYVVLVILSVSMALQVFYQVSWYILGINKKTKLIMAINIVGMLSNVIANYFVIPVYGIMGAALATFGSSTLMGILAIIVAAKIQGKFIFPTKTIGLIFLSAVILIASFLFRDRTFILSLSLFLSYLTVVVIYGILFEKEEVVKGIALIKKRLSGAKI